MAGWLIGAALGAGLSALQSAQANSDQKRAKRKYLQYLDKVKVNPLEEQKLLDATGDVYMGQTVDAMNSSVGQGNLLNRDTQMALIKAKGLGARASAQVQQKGKIFDFNKSIDLKKAEAEMAMPDQGLDFGAIAAGGLAGAQTGMGIESALQESKLLDEQMGWFKKLNLNTGETVGIDSKNRNALNPLLNKGLTKIASQTVPTVVGNAKANFTSWDLKPNYDPKLGYKPNISQNKLDSEFQKQGLLKNATERQSLLKVDLGSINNEEAYDFYIKGKISQNEYQKYLNEYGSFPNSNSKSESSFNPEKEDYLDLSREEAYNAFIKYKLTMEQYQNWLNKNR